MIDNSIKNTLTEKGFIFTEFKGTSMNPLLKQGRDKVYIEKHTSRLKKGDVALYVRKDGSHVLHRVYKVFDGHYAFWGDNHFVLEYGVKDQDVIGICKGFYKGEKYIDFSKRFGYKIYKAFWCSSVKLRKFLNLFRRAWRKFLKIFSKKSKKV